MKLIQQAYECTTAKKEAGAENGACGEEKVKNKELCIRSGAGDE